MMHCKLAHKETAIFCYIFKIHFFGNSGSQSRITEFNTGTCWYFKFLLPTNCLHACFHAYFHLHVCRENTGMFYVQTLSVLIRWGWCIEKKHWYKVFSGTQQLLVCVISLTSIKTQKFRFRYFELVIKRFMEK